MCMFMPMSQIMTKKINILLNMQLTFLWQHYNVWNLLLKNKLQIKNPGRKDVCGKRAVNIKNKSGSQHKKIQDHWTPGAITYYVRSGNRSAISYYIYICLSCLKKNLNSSNQNKNHLFKFGELLRLSINLFECSIYLYHLALGKGENKRK